MSFGVRKAPTGCNFVHNDEIWKDHVRRELQTSRKWPDKWGFLSQLAVTPAKEPLHQQHHGSVKLPPLKERRREDISNVAMVKLFDQALGYSANRKKHQYPQTTAGEVGWRSADFNTLERFGRHARGQQGIRHLLHWPREAVY